MAERRNRGGVMKKCVASEDGICRNVWAFGTRCDGYSERCALKPHYDNLSNAVNGLANSLRKAIGVVGDKE